MLASQFCSAQRASPRNGGDGVEKEGAPRHQPDEDESPEERERNGVVVARDAEVEIAEQVFVDEIKPGPAVDVAVGRLGDNPVSVREGDVWKIKQLTSFPKPAAK